MHDPLVRRETAATTTDDLATFGNVMMISSPVKAEEKKRRNEKMKKMLFLVSEKRSQKINLTSSTLYRKPGLPAHPRTEENKVLVVAVARRRFLGRQYFRKMGVELWPSGDMASGRMTSLGNC